MALRTALTEMFGIDHPVVLAPMGDVAGGALAAAVSEGGGLGVIGGGRGDLTWLARECDLALSAHGLIKVRVFTDDRAPVSIPIVLLYTVGRASWQRNARRAPL